MGGGSGSPEGIGGGGSDAGAATGGSSIFSNILGALGSGATAAAKPVAGGTTPVPGGSTSQSPVGQGQYPPILIPPTPVTPLGNSLQQLYSIYSGGPL